MNRTIIIASALGKTNPPWVGRFYELDYEEWIAESVTPLDDDYIDNGFGFLVPTRWSVVLRPATPQESEAERKRWSPAVEESLLRRLTKVVLP